MTEDPRHKLSLRGQLLDAQKSCCPCRLCGGAAVIKDAGPGFGYFIYCENSYATSNPSCLQAGVAIRGWAYACSELWNKLNKPVASRAAWPVKVKPLVWVHGAGFGKQEHSYADTELGTWCMTAYNGRGGRWAYTDPCGNDSEDDWLTRDECQTAVEAAREARILAELEPDQTALTLVAAAYRDAAEHIAGAGHTTAELNRGRMQAPGVLTRAHDAIIAKTPADATAALAAIERAAYERGAVAGWGAARKSVYGLCEAIEDRAASDLEKPQVADYQTGYLSAEKITAKQIRRTMGSFEARDDDNFLALLTQEGR